MCTYIYSSSTTTVPLVGPYVEVDDATACPSPSWWWWWWWCPIDTLHGCEAAAAYFGAADTKATWQDKQMRPAGCWVTASGQLMFNEGDGSTATEGQHLLCERCTITTCAASFASAGTRGGGCQTSSLEV